MTLDRHVYSLWDSRELYGTFISSVLIIIFRSSLPILFSDRVERFIVRLTRSYREMIDLQRRNNLCNGV